MANKTTFKKGLIPWNKGKKGLHKNPLKGKKMPTEWREKLRKPKKYVPPWSEERRKANAEFLRDLSKGQIGENNPRWKNGERVNSSKIRRERIKNATGNHNSGEWELLKKQYGYSCPCCHETEPTIKLTEDHIIPLSKGGSNFIENIQPLCGHCNYKKFTKIIKY